MLRLGAPALQQAAKGVEAVTQAPLFLGLPDAYRDRPAPANSSFLQHLKAQSGVEFDVARSQVFPKGRAATLLALEAALRCLSERQAEVVLVGGVDSYLDLALLSQLDLEDRILGPRIMDGFIPGEGAAFLALRPFRGASVERPPAI